MLNGGSLRWAAPETILEVDNPENSRPTVRSDVYSLASVWWEVAISPFYSNLRSNAVPFQIMAERKPFAELHNDVHVLTARHAGRTLGKPELCSAQLFHLMGECWLPDSHLRPTMNDLLGKIKLLASMGVLSWPGDLISHPASPTRATFLNQQAHRAHLLAKPHGPARPSRDLDCLQARGVIPLSSAHSTPFPSLMGFESSQSNRSHVDPLAHQDTQHLGSEFIPDTTSSHTLSLAPEGLSWSTSSNVDPYAQSVDVFAVAATQDRPPADMHPWLEEHPNLIVPSSSRMSTVPSSRDEGSSEGTSHLQGPVDLILAASIRSMTSNDDEEECMWVEQELLSAVDDSAASPTRTVSELNVCSLDDSQDIQDGCDPHLRKASWCIPAPRRHTGRALTALQRVRLGRDLLAQPEPIAGRG
jgi:hypothetical protein